MMKHTAHVDTDYFIRTNAEWYASDYILTGPDALISFSNIE